MTNSERRISYLNRVVAPPGEALPDVEILCRFARKMGYPGFDFPDNAAIFREHAELTRGTRIDISGLSYEILRARVTVQWPFPAGAKEGQARLYLDQVFATPNGRARIYYSVGANTSERTSPVLPLILTTGRIRDQWHTMTKTGKVNKLNQHLPQAFLEIHPRDAESRGLGEGDLAEVMNPRGAVRVRVKVTDDIRPGVVFLPMHWGRVAGRDLSRANNLTNPLLDPRSKEPDLKFAAVEVKKFRKPAQRVLVVGAGAGAFAFVKAHAALYPEDEITVFSQERHPFYNRVMLPDYISGVQTWDQLQKWTEADGKKGRVQLLTDLAVSRVDPQGHTVTDAQGQSHSYDLLVLATGSRSHRPKGLPENLDGLFTMRTREDADRMKTYLGEGASVLVVGGGLLGIEMAGALGEMGHRVTLLQRSSKLMDRQLDALGSSLLYEELMDRNIDVFFNDEVQAFLGQGRVEAVRLKSGRKIECHAVLFAIGTTPNIELAKAAGLDCNRGVLVNEFLQTSDQRIFAIGEIAEFQRQLYGITAAAEQQAEALVKYLSGDFSQPYQGSLSMNILKVQHLEICSLGLSETPADSDYEEVVFIDKASRYYKKCIIHRNRLVGAVLIGDKAEFLEFKDLIQNRIELSDKRLGLLRSGKKPEPVLGRLICSCNSVGSGNLEKKIAEGCRNFQELCNATGAGLGCGSCRPEVAKILEEAEEPVT